MKLFLLIIILTSIAALVKTVENEQFTADVYRELTKKNSDTFLVSPMSLKIVLALVRIGAGGQTGLQLSKSLSLPENPQEVQKLILRLLPQLQGNKQYQLKSANNIYVRNDVTIKPQYKTTAVNVFKAGAQNINFGNSQKAANEINKWIEEHTDHKIKDMVSKDNFHGDVVLVLINAMYFHGKWVTKFDTKKTKQRQFFFNKKNKINVNMIEVTSSFKLYKNANLKASFLEMPYQGQDITMTIILPNDIEELHVLEARIADVLLPPPYGVKVVNVVIPKVKIETKIEFKSILQKLGVKDAFSSHANFSGISNAPVTISEILQKTYMEVDEEGTTASVATVVKLPQRSKRLPQEFIANHPFIFYLKSKAGIIFIGRYTGKM